MSALLTVFWSWIVPWAGPVFATAARHLPGLPRLKAWGASFFTIIVIASLLFLASAAFRHLLPRAETGAQVAARISAEATRALQKEAAAARAANERAAQARALAAEADERAELFEERLDALIKAQPADAAAAKCFSDEIAKEVDR